MKFLRNMLILVALVSLAIFVLAFKTQAVRTSLPGRVVRWCFGEPGATQWVNDTADMIVEKHSARELEDLADQLVRDPNEIVKSRSNHKGAYPTSRQELGSRLAPNYRRCFGIFESEPNVFILHARDDSPIVQLSWDNMRQEVFVFTRAPSTPPCAGSVESSPHRFRPFFVRKIDSRLYVVANDD